MLLACDVLLGDAIPSIIAISIVESFYILRIWNLGKRSYALLLILPAVLAPCFAMAFRIANFVHPSLFVGRKDFAVAEWLTCAAAACYAITDVGVAVTLSLPLHIKETSLRILQVVANDCDQLYRCHSAVHKCDYAAISGHIRRLFR